MQGQIYIPDISGFSQFVTETDLLHGQSITIKLLKTIIESNKLDLDIYEIEGDSISYINLKHKYNPSQYLNNSMTIIERFYEETKSMVFSTQCQCNACKSISNLGLKFVIHEDDLSHIEIMNHRKLYGKGMILVHRLLKNKIQSNDYILFTEKFLKNYPENNPGNLIIYDHEDPIMGNIEARYLHLK